MRLFLVFCCFLNLAKCFQFRVFAFTFSYCDQIASIGQHLRSNRVIGVALIKWHMHSKKKKQKKATSVLDGRLT